MVILYLFVGYNCPVCFTYKCAIYVANKVYSKPIGMRHVQKCTGTSGVIGRDSGVNIFVECQFHDDVVIQTADE